MNPVFYCRRVAGFPQGCYNLSLHIFIYSRIDIRTFIFLYRTFRDILHLLQMRPQIVGKNIRTVYISNEKICQFINKGLFIIILIVLKLSIVQYTRTIIHLPHNPLAHSLTHCTESRVRQRISHLFREIIHPRKRHSVI